MAPQSANCRDRLEFATLSDIGLRRSNNQDSYSVAVAPSPTAWQQRGDLFMVADGMGAHAAGELASKLSTDTVPLVYHKLADRSVPEAILAAVQEANTHIHSRGQGSPDFKGMGTTTSILLLTPQGAIVAHVGDSRIYRLRKNRLEQLTFDHSLVWEMRAQGQIKDKVPDFIPKNVITRSLGPNATVQVDLEGPHPVLPGDTFLLCSDGLSGQVEDEELGMILNCLAPDDAVRILVDLANLRGGPDNITVIVTRAIGSQWTRPQPTMPGDDVPIKTRPVNPIVWIAAGVLGLASFGLLGMGATVAGLLTLVAAGAVAGGALIYSLNGGEAPRYTGQRLGRGPYTATDCTPNAAFVGRLADVARDLVEAAKQGDLGVDWGRFNKLMDRGAAAADFAQAVGQYCGAISFMIAELKRLGQR